MLLSGITVGSYTVTSDSRPSVMRRINTTWETLTQADVGCIALGEPVNGDFENQFLAVWSGSDLVGAVMLGCIDYLSDSLGTVHVVARVMPCVDSLGAAAAGLILKGILEATFDLSASPNDTGFSDDIAPVSRQPEYSKMVFDRLKYEIVAGRTGGNDVRAAALHTAIKATPGLSVTERTDSTFTGRAGESRQLVEVALV